MLFIFFEIALIGFTLHEIKQCIVFFWDTRYIEHDNMEIFNLLTENFGKYITLLKQPKLNPYCT